MARNNDRDKGTTKRAPKINDRRPAKKKAPPVPEGSYIDYKDLLLLRKFMSDRGKIRSRRVSGLSTQMQRDIAIAIKTARELALLPYATRTVAERGPRRGPRRDNAAPSAAVDAELGADIDDADDDGAAEEGE
jgi:small subunit ribosomal protein S18